MVKIYFDGGCKPNPGQMEIGVVFVHEDGSEKAYYEKLGDGTNNQAEWLALIYGLFRASELGFTEVEMIGDSKNVCMQASGTWKMKPSSKLYSFWQEFKQIEGDFSSLKVSHVLRHMNLAGIMLEERK